MKALRAGLALRRGAVEAVEARSSSDAMEAGDEDGEAYGSEEMRREEVGKALSLSLALFILSPLDIVASDINLDASGVFVIVHWVGWLECKLGGGACARQMTAKTMERLRMLVNSSKTSVIMGCAAHI